MLVFLSMFTLYAQKVTVSGKITDQSTGEVMIGAVVGGDGGSSVSNVGGFYTLVLSPGHHVLECGYLGYSSQVIDVVLARDTVINIALRPEIESLGAATVTTRRKTAFEAVAPGAIEMPVTVFSQTPSLLGENDVMKTLQLLPGVQSGLSGFSGLYVRGGGPDENLMLLDGLPLYNAEHLLGLFSVFMPEAIKKVTLYKGAFPARYGGRLSSVLDLRTNDGNAERFSGEMGVNLLSSKLHLEGPWGSKATTFSLSGRMMNTLLADAAIRAIDRREKGNYWFYDIDGKITHRLSERDKLSLNIYNGRDHLYVYEDVDNAGFAPGISTKTTSNIGWGNFQLRGSWDHVLGPKLYSVAAVGYNRYRMRTGILEDVPPEITEDKVRRISSLDYRSGMDDVSASIDFDYHPSNAHVIRYGLEGILHKFSPETYGMQMKDWEKDGEPARDTSITSTGSQIIKAVECSAYIEDEISIGSRITFAPGFRFNIFNVRGKTYLSPEPRLSARYALENGLALKAGYSRMSQSIHLLSSTQLTLPMDLWVPATETLRPMTSDQFSLGCYYGGLEGWEFSLEGYYKSMGNILEYKDGVPVMGNSASWEDKVEMGVGRSYGAEMLLRKTSGKLTGWAAYTLAKTERRFPDGTINRGAWFPYKYDRRHSVNLFASYSFSKSLEASATWTFASGGVTTVPVRQTVIIDPEGNQLQQVNATYSRGNYRLPPSHVLNVGVSWHRQKRRGVATWSASIYNIYNQMNSDLLLASLSAQRKSSAAYVANYKVKSVTIIPILPSIGYSFKF